MHQRAELDLLILPGRWDLWASWGSSYTLTREVGVGGGILMSGQQPSWRSKVLTHLSSSYFSPYTPSRDLDQGLEVNKWRPLSTFGQEEQICLRRDFILTSCWESLLSFIWSRKTTHHTQLYIHPTLYRQTLSPSSWSILNVFWLQSQMKSLTLFHLIFGNILVLGKLWKWCGCPIFCFYGGRIATNRGSVL